MQAVRLIFQLFFIELILYYAILFSIGASYKNCESYCPFGAVETLALFVQTGRFPCAVNEFNYSILAGVIILTIVFKRAFCSWVCPLGAVNELITFVRQHFIRYVPYNVNLMKVLFSIKYILLAIIVAASYHYYDLVFRPYCPYFTAFGIHGHTTEIISYFILFNVLSVTVFIKFGFCRVLCPFGAFLNLFNYHTAFKIYRDDKSCDRCGRCDALCPAEIKISQKFKITDTGCTMCLKCVSTCGKNNSLKVGF